MPLPTYDAWIRSTESFGRVRSKELRDVDAAVKGGNAGAVKTALDRWRFEQSKGGKTWQESVRNKTGAVTALHRAVTELPKKPSKEELEAWKYMTQQQRMALIRTFRSTKLVFKGDTLAGMVRGTSTKWQKLKQGAGLANQALGAFGTGADFAGAVSGGRTSNPLEMIKDKVAKAITDLCPGLNADSVMTQLGLPGVAQFAKDAAPILGAITSGIKLAQAWADVAMTAQQKYQLHTARFAIAKGDPEAALNAINALLTRELASNTASATSATVSFGMKVGGMVGDMGAVSGPVVAAIQTLAEIMQAIYEFVRGLKEVDRANQMLELGALNLDLFQTCPILGCYFLAMQDHSTIIAFAVEEYGTANWMFDVERMVKALYPVLGSARRMVKDSKFELMGVGIDDTTAEIKLASLQQSKGLVDQSFAVKTGMAKALALPGQVKSNLTERFESTMEKLTNRFASIGRRGP